MPKYCLTADVLASKDALCASIAKLKLSMLSATFINDSGSNWIFTGLVRLLSNIVTVSAIDC